MNYLQIYLPLKLLIHHPHYHVWLLKFKHNNEQTFFQGDFNLHCDLTLALKNLIMPNMAAKGAMVLEGFVQRTTYRHSDKAILLQKKKKKVNTYFIVVGDSVCFNFILWHNHTTVLKAFIFCMQAGVAERSTLSSAV